MDKDLVDYALDYARSKKIEYAETRAHNTEFEQLVIKNGTLDAFISTIDKGFCVRILADGGLGFASSNKWTKDEARILVDRAHKKVSGEQDKKSRTKKAASYPQTLKSVKYEDAEAKPTEKP